MADLPREIVNVGRDYLLRVLKQEPTITYDRFYDGGDECRQKLCEGLGMSASDADWYGAEGVMDTAIAFLERDGIVTTGELPDRLADGVLNYEISLTENGRALLAA